ncbi:DUF2062 domain-containing protein [Flavobacterium sp. HSC-61S13]|uniref:DUF2062 domain-containing protein n=1 Tax=Flavobacterium sp. HSC-61S13 TaxID=2910963 RepID=UPI0020A0C7F9|nr:DUF2062 domain-containing protein [Flavobacterium sp. HSC-61S13]MCP1996327.1 glycosyltransferase involved in cell wall biosynthesis [Flavobacterium sp. HSC-61S13]
MNVLLNTTDKMQQHAICVIIPTYNNPKTLSRVIEGVLCFTDDIIIINDGSTDQTASILEGYSDLHQIHFSTNCGKGYALRQGFKRALDLGYNYAITIDSDGQHFPEDIPIFVDKHIAAEQDILWIGSRNMNQENVPKKSSFGNKFSNFWFWFETGIQLNDTQSGYRMYPLKSIPKKYVTRKFEFEIEVIVRTAWRHVPVQNVPINILYDPNERVSHFRPFKDFARISVLNTVLVVIALLYIFPRNLVLRFKKKSFKKFLREDILGSDDSNEKKALSIALGTFIGIAPLWGLQSFLSIFLAAVLRLNKALSFAFSNVSIPPMIPLIIYGSLQVGGLFFYSTQVPFNFDQISVDMISNHLFQYLIGSVILATVVATSFGFGSYVLLRFFKNK